MDEFRQVGPDKPGYGDDIQKIVDALDADQAVTFRFAAKSTACTVTLAALSGAVVVGQRPHGIGDDGLFVAVEGRGAAWLPANGPIYWAALDGYTNVRGGVFIDTADDHPFADLVNAVLARATFVDLDEEDRT